ncbi:MAG: fasciclin domain-containing protein, partial [Fulvivirga sp.]|nr:fasciclin domain-containing protein [Fulvivirga sp.]
MNKNRGITLLIAVLMVVLLPEAAKSQKIMTVIKSHSNLSSFADALEQNGLDEELSGNGPYTIFAPVNESFDRETSGKSITSSSVRNLLLNHIMTGYATERNMKVMSKATSLGG